MLLLSADQKITEALFTAPGMDGVRMRIGWDQLQPTEDKIDWSQIDLAISYAKKQGRTLTVGINTTSAAPKFVLDAKPATITLDAKEKLAGIKMPVPWDPIFLAKEEALAKALAAHVDNEPVVTGVVMGGFGQTGEGYVAKSDAEVAQANAAGGLTAYVAGMKKLIDSYASYFKSTPFIYTAANPYSRSGGQPQMNEIIDYGCSKYPLFGFMNSQLNAKTQAASGNSTAAMVKYHASHPVGFQFLTSGHGFNDRTLGGSLEDCLKIAVSVPVNYVEAYQSDATDANKSLFQTYSAKLSSP